MPDLVITPAQVAKVSGTTLNVTAGENLSAGDPCYLKAAKYYKAENHKTDGSNSENDDAANVAGIALEDAVTDATFDMLDRTLAGVLTLGADANVVDKVCYVLSKNSGKIAPVGDLQMGDRAVILGLGNATDGLVYPS